MHGLNCVYNGGHLYGPGGIGWRDYDVSKHVTREGEMETRDLPGFVEDNVTYESHHFWVHFVKGTSKDHEVFIRVNHGGGWEVWRGDYMLAKALRRYGDNDHGLFLLCWYMIDAARAARDAGRQEAAAEYRKAFVDGRLKKRKLPARGQVKVWIEPEQVTQPAVA